MPCPSSHNPSPNAPLPLYQLLADLTSRGEPFVLATVILSSGSASAREGAKAVFSADGRLLTGYIGGGCAEGTVAGEAVEALKDGQPRRVEIVLSDELGASGMPCGGRMEIWVEPHLAKPEILVLGHGRIVQALSEFGSRAGFRVIVDDPQGTREAYPAAERIVTDDPDYEKLAAKGTTWVVVATHHKSDHLAIRRALDLGAAGISMIASTKRRTVVYDMLLEMGVTPDQLRAIRSPAGLDLGGGAPEEIALSVVAEIVAVRNGASGRPMMDVKASAKPQKT